MFTKDEGEAGCGTVMQWDTTQHKKKRSADTRYMREHTMLTEKSDPKGHMLCGSISIQNAEANS